MSDDTLRNVERPDNHLLLFDHCDPALDAGSNYQVRVRQEVEDLLDSTGTVHIRVIGPQVRLQPADIVGAYPAPGSIDSPPEFLPHVALARRTLPWERSGPSTGVPWLALLLFEEGELPSMGKPKPTRMTTVGELANDAPLAHAGIQDELPGTAPVEVVDVPKALLEEVLPRQDELALLCHMRRLLSEDAPMSDLDDDGDVAIVLCNRLPKDSEKVHHAMLVSLEGRSDLYEGWGELSLMKSLELEPSSDREVSLDSARALEIEVTDDRSTEAGDGLVIDKDQIGELGPLIPMWGETTPVIVLHRWSFTPSKDDGDFEAVIKRIRVEPNGGVLRFGSLPREQASTPPAAIVDTGGFLDEELRFPQAADGEARYRGPMRPYPVSARPDLFALRARPQELGLDVPGAEEDPAPDVSRLAAFELGRLLALSNDRVLAALRHIGWRIEAIEFEEVRAFDPRPEALRLPETVTDPWHSQGWAPQADRFAAQSERPALLDMQRISDAEVDVAGALEERIASLGGIAELSNQLGAELEQADQPGPFEQAEDSDQSSLDISFADLMIAAQS